MRVHGLLDRPLRCHGGPRRLAIAAAALLALGCPAPDHRDPDASAEDARADDAPSIARADAGSDAPVDAGPLPDRVSAIEVALEAPLARIDERFLSFAIDSAQLVGGTFWDPSGMSTGTTGDYPVPPYDFASAKVRRLARELAPAFLRLGGTDADLVYYDLSDAPREEPPAGYEWVMTRAQWDGVHDFLAATELDLLFTLNAGPGPRDAERRWDPAQARELMTFARDHAQEVAVWELGNEPNGYRLIHALDPDPTGHVAAYRALAALRDELDPDARIAGPATAYWPSTGELGRFYPDFVAAGGLEPVDIVTWHYYPQQSRRCPIRPTPAEPYTMLDPARLAEIDRWAAEVEDAVTDDGEVWVGESGGAQCGGEPGVSDRFVGSFWWADQLGRMARRGERVVVRQTLSGGTYGMLEDESLDPRPDYWISVLWRRTMGTEVLSATSTDRELLAYAHCQRAGERGAISLLLINLTPSQATAVDLSSLGARREVFLAHGPLFEPGFVLNGAALSAAADGTLPPLEPVREANGVLRLPAASIAFVVLPDAAAAACP